MYVAYLSDAAVGFAATRMIEESHIELAGIVVLRSMLGRGIGTPLVEAAVAACRAQGVERITVSTETNNERAISFYRARGFEPVDESIVQVEGTHVAVCNLELSL